jgi:hypothetical protein
MAWIVNILAGLAAAAAPATQPSTRPIDVLTNAAAAVKQDEVDLDAARSACLRALGKNETYRALVADRDARSIVLNNARSCSDSQEKLAASHDFIAAEQVVTMARRDALAHDQPTRQAISRLDQDKTAMTRAIAAEDIAGKDAAAPRARASKVGTLALGMSVSQALNLTTQQGLGHVLKNEGEVTVYQIGLTVSGDKLEEPEHGLWVIMHTLTFRDGKLTNIYHHDVQSQISTGVISGGS